MSNSRGRRQLNQFYSGYRQAPNDSSYSAPSMGRNDQYYGQDPAAYRQEFAGYDAALAQQSQNGTRGATWPYEHEQERGGYDQRPWGREEEARTQYGYDDYHNYRGDDQRPPDSQQEPYTREWRDYAPGYPYPADPYPHPEQRYSEYSSYNDYPNRIAEYQQNSYNGGYSDYRWSQDPAYPPPRGDSRGGGYTDYHRAPLPVRERDYEERDRYTNYRRSPSPLQPAQSRGFSSHVRGPVTKPYLVKPFISKPPSPLHMMTQKVTEPREEYLSISLRPSLPLADPSAGPPKLLILDLNGSLLLRAAHKRSQFPLGRGTNVKNGGAPDAPFDPYGDPTLTRPLRAVHRRPYLTSFTAYILHEETKKWLETMVWSSAQPHSVADMVEHCFGERKAELKAVWARDTLGLSSNDYNKKAVTLKDMEKPCAQLLSPKVVRDSKKPHASPDDNRRSKAADISSPSVRSALTALLVDDSPAKAALQPWNHLVIREYLQDTRNHDLIVADWESNLESTEMAERTTASDPEHPSASTTDKPSENGEGVRKGDGYPNNVTEEEVEKFLNQTISESSQETKVSEAEANVVRRVIHEVVMIDGEMVEPEQSILKDTAIMGVDPTSYASTTATATGEFVPNQRRKQKRQAKKEIARKEREEKEREAFIALRDKQGQAEQARQKQMAQWIGGNEETRKILDDLALVLRYDETLLAVVGVLDQIKHESNVAGWLRSGGLINVALSNLKSKSTTTTTTTTTSTSAVSPADNDANRDTPAPPAAAEVAVRAGTKHRAPSPSPSPGPDRNQSPSSASQSPAKRRKLSASIKDQPETHDEIDNLEIIPPPSPSPNATSASPSPCASTDAKEQASTGVPLSSPIPALANPVQQQAPDSPAPAPAPAAGEQQQEAGLWYENPVVLFYWADRGRNALRELGIPVESGMVANPRARHVKNTEEEGRADMKANVNVNANTNANAHANYNNT